MKIKKQFIILSSLIISIPILCSIFIIVHTYIHSPNRYLLSGYSESARQELDALTNNNSTTIERALKMVPKDVETLVCRVSDRKIIYSSIPEIKVGTEMQKDEIWDFTAKTSDKYYYQFSRMLAHSDSQIILISRLPIQKISNERKTKNYLIILLIVISITISSLILITFISRTIFMGLKTIENSSTRLAQGQLEDPLTTNYSISAGNEFENIMNSLEKMRQELVEIQTRKNSFITGISHDLRTPVAVIRGYSEAIKDNVISEKDEIQKTMELIEQKTTQLEDMIDTLLNFMKLNNSEIKEKLVKHSITKLINDFAKYAEVTCKVFKRNVHTNIQLDKDIKVPLNEQLVHRSFENLLSNAIRYTKENDLIEINAYTSENEKTKAIILEIKDSGCGIDKKDLEYIFDIFYRGTNSRQEEGMGIGLAVVKSIIETHGWNIAVESIKNKGSCFTINIPYKKN